MKSLRDPCKGFIPQNNELIPKNDGFVGNMYFFAFKSDIISGIYTLNFEGGGVHILEEKCCCFPYVSCCWGLEKNSQCLLAFFKRTETKKTWGVFKRNENQVPVENKLPRF